LKKFFNLAKSFARTKLSHDKGVKNMRKIIKLSAMPTSTISVSSFFNANNIPPGIQGPREDKLLRAKPKLGYQNKAQDEVKHTNSRKPKKYIQKTNETEQKATK